MFIQNSRVRRLVLGTIWRTAQSYDKQAHITYYIWSQTARGTFLAFSVNCAFNCHWNICCHWNFFCHWNWVAIKTGLPLELSCHWKFCSHWYFCCHWNLVAIRTLVAIELNWNWTENELKMNWKWTEIELKLKDIRFHSWTKRPLHGSWTIF